MTPRDRVALRYVALGDSYTIGTGVDPADRWPAQLVAAVADAANSTVLELVANLGVDGRTSADLIRDQLPELPRWRPEVVTVLIGVNDAIQGIPADVYAANLRTILDALLTTLRPDRIVTVGIPDYTVTPRGADYGEPSRQSRAIVAFNAAMARASLERSVRFVDVLDLSRRAATDRSMVAPDGLHPSAAQYASWVDRIAPVVATLLAGSARLNPRA